MVELARHGEGWVLPVRARPGARASGIQGVAQGALKVSVTTAAEKGKANKALIALLSKQLGLRKSQIELISGPTASQKRFLIRDVDGQTLQEKIAQALQK